MTNSILVAKLPPASHELHFPHHPFPLSINLTKTIMSAPTMNVAMMTSGGLAPCLSSSVAYLIEYWSAALKAGSISGLTIRMYIDGYKGVLSGDSTILPPEIYDDCTCLHELGGSPIGNSRVKVR